jgi:dTDP-4-amino-4,6-dideoxygalactose transaminase
MADPLKVPYLDLTAQMRPLRPEIDAAIARVLDTNAFCLGPEVTAFEQAFAAFVGVQHCIAFNSGTSALHVAMRLLNVGPGDEVITTPYTFAASSWCISYVGARPVYVDIEPDTFNLDPTKIEAAITPRTRAILPVDLYGHPFEADAIHAIAARHGIAVVEDAAQAHGAVYHGRNAGTLGAMAGFSFYPAKNLGACGEGGALVTEDDAFAARARSLREHGSSCRYHYDEVGYNYRMEGLQGAVLAVKLKRLKEWTSGRRRVAARYAELLADTPLRLPVEKDGVQSAWHLYVVRHPRRDELKAHLEKHGIGCAIHYPLPLHLQPCYASLGHRPGDFPVAEQVSKECLCLPMFPELTGEQLQRVAEVIKGFPF